jgi:hypothetical protein
MESGWQKDFCEKKALYASTVIGEAVKIREWN